MTPYPGESSGCRDVSLRQTLRPGLSWARSFVPGMDQIPGMPTRLLNVAQVAAMLGLHPETVRQMAREKSLPALKLGGRTSPYRFRESAIEAHLVTLERRHSRRH